MFFHLSNELWPTPFFKEWGVGMGYRNCATVYRDLNEKNPLSVHESIVMKNITILYFVSIKTIKLKKTFSDAVDNFIEHMIS